MNIILTFDDGLTTQYNFVKPLLKKYGFLATFFVTGARNILLAPEGTIDWPLVKELEDDGHEIANHTFSHVDCTEVVKDDFLDQVSSTEKSFINAGLSKPVSFCYPGNHSNSLLAAMLKDMGYKFARTGYGMDDWRRWKSMRGQGKTASGWPEAAFNDRENVPYFKVKKSNPTLLLNHNGNDANTLLLNQTGLVNSQYGISHFIDDLNYVSGKIRDDEEGYAIFTFHGFARESDQENFKEMLTFLKEGGYHTKRLRDLPHASK